MFRELRWLFLLVCCVGVLQLSVQGGEFAGPSGAKFRYPDDWVAGTAVTLNDLPVNIQTYFRERNIDLNAMEVMLVDDALDDFVENVNLVVTPGEIRVSQRVVDERVLNLPKEYSKLGMQVGNISAGLIQAAGRSAIQIEQSLTIEGMPFRQRQVIVPGGGKTFILTFSGGIESFDREAPAMDLMLATLEVPAVRGGFDFGAIFSSGKNGAVIGGIVGGLSALGFGLARKSAGGKPKPTSKKS